MLSNEQLAKLKGKVNSLEDLRKIAVNEGISFTEVELQEAYDKVMGFNEEVSLDELDNVSGGAEVPYGDRECETIVSYVKYRCKYCNTLVWFPRNAGQPWPCPYCNKRQKYDKKRKVC